MSNFENVFFLYKYTILGYKDIKIDTLKNKDYSTNANKIY